ncbi:MAG: signal recognition particle-docking protein FtsY [Candidatus Dadabacteria bacterium]|nr:signal recognition particle-docking protein FtsY [Candidatus Dadabacteria bacterium]NIQ13484.1 signal recognition particle-docking protein FtsY [Candidatus Dadabacteria bacterium]
MEYIKSLIDLIYSFESPATDISIVFALFVVIYSLIVLVLFPFTRKKKPVGKKPEEQAEKLEEIKKEVKQDVSGFRSSIEPEVSEISQVEEVDETTIAKEVDTSLFEAPAKLEEEAITEETKEVPQEIISEVAEVEVEEVEEVVEREVAEKAEVPEASFFSKLRSGLSKTQEGLLGRLGSVFTGAGIDESTWDEFEEILIMSDIGVPTTMKLKDKISERISKSPDTDFQTIKEALKNEVLDILKNAEGGPINLDNKPSVLMIAGVNGVGKTTSIGKISNLYVNNGKKVMVAAADTFRAAAVEQLEVWSNRVGSDFIKGQTGADPSAVAFDAVQASKARNIDVLIIDTAGRLHTKSNLMDELKKLRRVIGRELEGAPHETLLVLDATTGQNAVQQAKMFNEAIDITGIILTKLDGTAKGGVIIAIADELNIPVKYIGVGEGLNDLREFNAEEFVEALFMSGNQTIH